ncbi:pirin family protein [Empedobacter falsenii]|uniref:Pirin family protein n=1 Tax=Empedobacter falsenii TaxID=343874 RepID=A0A3R8ST36_9FLAO|nr:pirin family protein [Empedobacter falsenii]RRT93410.1 pirin family protein [Empedobacter falsenii]RRT93556.1 pirin family protein [Empedobacter falsenii]
MNYQIFKSESRGGGNHGWLDSKHSYSFANYYDPARIHFGALRVVNDDIITGGMGFGKHPHDNMEIITIPTKGGISHEDSMGTGSVIESGDVQVMSAGTGVFHSEMNAYENQEVHFFQIWIIPNKMNVEPRYQQISVREVAKENELYQVLSPNADDQGVWIHQDAWIFLGNYTEDKQEIYKVQKEGNGVFFMVVEGEVEFDGNKLGRRDVIEIKDTNEFSFNVAKDSRLMLIEVPMDI